MANDSEAKLLSILIELRFKPACSLLDEKLGSGNWAKDFNNAIHVDSSLSIQQPIQYSSLKHLIIPVLTKSYEKLHLRDGSHFAFDHILVIYS
jgi:hypothetical protein